MSNTEILIYGAYGYTGELIAELCAAEGVTPILAGRDADRVAGLAERHGFPHRVFGLDDPAQLDAGLQDVKVVAHCAGPFHRTAKPMIDACLRTGTHYLDITGEISVFEDTFARDGEAKTAGVMLMPGTGFDVVPSDCLANHLKGLLPDATDLTLAFSQIGGKLSHGTALTTVESMPNGGFVRRDGEMVAVSIGSVTKKIDYGRGPQASMAIPWGDVSSAYRSTGIPNIAVFTPAPPIVAAGARVMGMFTGITGSRWFQNGAKGFLDRNLRGPDETKRKASTVLMVGEVSNDAGDTRRARLELPDGYTLTALTCLAICRRVIAGDAPVGFQTPASAYGADLITEVEGCQFIEA